ncbi:MAG: hypothetical protein NTW21_14105 [Verrucomicrobia bacterium]|nr:hypothetical protein [Verrucomicrobiota bacterium]
MKFGSASVPIYLSTSKGRTRYLLCHYRDGKRLRQVFGIQRKMKKDLSLHGWVAIFRARGRPDDGVSRVVTLESSP